MSLLVTLAVGMLLDACGFAAAASIAAARAEAFTRTLTRAEDRDWPL